MFYAELKIYINIQYPVFLPVFTISVWLRMTIMPANCVILFYKHTNGWQLVLHSTHCTDTSSIAMPLVHKNIALDTLWGLRLALLQIWQCLHVTNCEWIYSCKV